MYHSAEIDEEQNRRKPGWRILAGSAPAGWRVAFFKIGAVALIGGALPLLLVDAVPQKFEAQTRLKVEAAGEKAVGDAAAALRSKANLDNLIHALNLGSGSEFSVDRPTVVRVVSDIVSGEAMTVSQAENRMRDRLSQAIATGYDRRTGEFAITVTTSKADEAVRIANMLAGTFRDEVSFSDTKASAPLVEKLRQTLDRAEAALSGFTSQTDERKLAEMRRSSGEGQQLAMEMSDAESQLADLKQKSAQASAMKLDDVLNKPLPDSLEYTGLDYQRQRHVEAKLAVDQLSGNLGPRHPRLLAAQAALDDVRSGIQTALKQLVVSLRQQETAAAKHLADLKAKRSKMPDDKEIADSAARLAALETAVEEARANYLEALHRAETEPKASTAAASIVEPATVESARSQGLSSVEIAGGGTLVGLLVGTALAWLTRRRAPAESDEIEPVLAEEPGLLADADWQGDVADEPADVLEDNPSYYHQDYDEPQQSYQSRYPEPANDSPLADQIREMLMASRRPAQEADLPPLLASIMAGRLVDAPPAATRVSAEEMRKAEEFRELRRDMAELRERLQLYSARRSASRR